MEPSYLTFNVRDNSTASVEEISSILDRRGARLKHKVTEDARMVQLAEKAIEEADDRTSLYFPCVPQCFTAVDLVKELHKVMYDAGWVNTDFSKYDMTESFQDMKPPILRCQVSQTRRSISNAVVTVRTYLLAECIVKASPILLKNIYTKILFSNRPEGAGSLRRNLRDVPDCPTYDIGCLQFGQLDAPSLFVSFWSSNDHFLIPTQRNTADLKSMDALVQLNLAERLIAISTLNFFEMFDQDLRSTTSSRLRIEIPFHAIPIAPFVQHTNDDSKCRIICIPVSHTPFIFKEQYNAFTGGSENAYWDLVTGNTRPSSWVRTVDSTLGNAIARASIVRFSISVDVLGSFLRKLEVIGVTHQVQKYIRYVEEIAESRKPSLHTVFQRAASRHRISFSVRYMVACIFCCGNMNAQALTDAFWFKLLICGSDKKMLDVLNLMYIYVTGTAFSIGLDPEVLNKLIDDRREEQSMLAKNPFRILHRCMQMCGKDDDIYGYDSDEDRGEKSKNVQNDSDSLSNSDVSDISTVSDETENILVEDTLRALRLDGSRSWNPMSVPLSLSASTETISSELETSKPGSKPRRPHWEAMIRRVSITPTRIICHPSEKDLLNRVLRQFMSNRDRFIRVSFCDEDGCPISHRSTPHLLERVASSLRDGIHVGGEHFVFLAFSNSQLRDHSTWMYNETSNDIDSQPPTADDIRKWMGDFSDIRVPGKFASRQGQAFSSTVSTVELDDIHYDIVSDVYDSSHKYMFSDGIGIVKSDVAKKMARRLGVKSGRFIPSAFQIRFGGAKGMLTVWDNAFPKDTDPSIRMIIRKSMKKFNCEHRAVEVVGYARRISLFLNRQIITLLSDHGVPEQAFMKLQSKALEDLNKAMTRNGLKHALRFLFAHNNDGFSHKVTSCGTGVQLISYLWAGLDCVNCEHLFNMVLAYRHRLIRDLVERTRIPIDVDKGLCAIGVLDELGVLGENEIFCQYTDPETKTLKIVEGSVTIGRSPCLHPGDIQPVNAVDKTQLRHLVDVIVFPKTGDRPLPSMLSGGDLDGDIFFCIMDESLRLPNRKAFPAMNYTSPQPNELDRPVTWRDVVDFFVSFIKNDCVGLIANAHLVNWDKSVLGTRSRECLMLAEFHSAAVDFPKTGVSVADEVRGSRLLPQYRRNFYPDFMGKHKAVSYKSKNILGKLYRTCISHVTNEDDKEELQFEESKYSLKVHKIFHNLATDCQMMEEADKLCHMYNTELQMLMVRYGIVNEGEIISGQVLRFENGLSNMFGKEKHHYLQMRVNRQVHDLQVRFRKEFFSDVDEDDEELMRMKASCWYTACRKISLHVKKDPSAIVILSFPWVVSDILFRILKPVLRPSKTCTE